MLNPSQRKLVVVGNGMVGHRFCERIHDYAAPGQFQITVFGEESRPAYDRVQLTRYFEEDSADALQLASKEWYAEREIDLKLGARITRIDREARVVHTDAGEELAYDQLVLATGSAPFVPPMPGVDLDGVFVYRTIDDLDAIKAYAEKAKRCAVLGGGLLGLEAARAVQQCGLEAHVVEMAPRLMPRQLDSVGSRLLERSIEAMGVGLHLGKATREVAGEGAVEAMVFGDGEALEVDMLVISAGIKPRDELARQADLQVGNRGGIVVDDQMTTSDGSVLAIGECALHRGMIYGLVAPGYEMADVAAKKLMGQEASFEGADMSTKLKLMGVEVASFGEPLATGPGVSDVAFQDFMGGTYKKLVIDNESRKLVGGILVGDTSAYAALLHRCRSEEPVGDKPEELILGARGEGGGGVAALPDEAQVCSCNNVLKGDICSAVRGGTTDLGELKSCTQAGTGCGGCMPLVTDLLNAELAAMGQSVKQRLCEHFDFTRQEIFDLIKVKDIRDFDTLIAEHGTGAGCEVCKPTAASVFASLHNDMILNRHLALQDTNDRFLANVQRRGLYSVIPRIPGGEITPDNLIRLGEIAKQYGLYTKITGGQRIDMLGARLNQLPDIWQDLVQAGFESGHAYAKALRTVKSCVGKSWCRYGVQDSVSMAIQLEERYRGIRAPHKLKSAVSGCVRECAEAQSKDFGVIATEKGWNLYVCGNGGTKPRHADLLATEIDDAHLIRYIDRFLMYYICTADKLTRTSAWVDKLEGGIDHVRDVVVNDSLGLGAELEAMMGYLVDSYECEWKAVVESPELRQRFRHFANTESEDDTVFMISERHQHRPADWQKSPAPEAPIKLHLPVIEREWIDVGATGEFPENTGVAVQHGGVQIAVYNAASQSEWYATQNMCPHMQDMVLARGIVGDKAGEPKVACPQHKKNFSLKSGECLSGENYRLHVFPVRIDGGRVLVEVPPAKELEGELCPSRVPCTADAAE